MYPMAVFLPCLIVVDAPVLVRRVAIDQYLIFLAVWKGDAVKRSGALQKVSRDQVNQRRAGSLAGQRRGRCHANANTATPAICPELY
jgi:hypothetical protein